MGHSTDLFVNSTIDDEYLCAICQDVLQDPMVIAPCQHAYCKSCIQQWRQTAMTCPIDREHIGQLQPPMRNFVNLLNKLEMHCKFSGCESTFALGDIKGHEEKCNYNPFKGTKRSLEDIPEEAPPPKRSHNNMFFRWNESSDSDDDDDWGFAPFHFDSAPASPASVNSLPLSVGSNSEPLLHNTNWDLDFTGDSIHSPRASIAGSDQSDFDAPEDQDNEDNHNVTANMESDDEDNNSINVNLRSESDDDEVQVVRDDHSSINNDNRHAEQHSDEESLFSISSIKPESDSDNDFDGDQHGDRSSSVALGGGVSPIAQDSDDDEEFAYNPYNGPSESDGDDNRRSDDSDGGIDSPVQREGEESNDYATPAHSEEEGSENEDEAPPPVSVSNSTDNDSESIQARDWSDPEESDFDNNHTDHEEGRESSARFSDSDGDGVSVDFSQSDFDFSDQDDEY